MDSLGCEYTIPGTFPCFLSRQITFLSLVTEAVAALCHSELVTAVCAHDGLGITGGAAEQHSTPQRGCTDPGCAWCLHTRSCQAMQAGSRLTVLRGIASMASGGSAPASLCPSISGAWHGHRVSLPQPPPSLLLSSALKAVVQSSDTNLAHKQQLTQQAAWGGSALLQAHAGSS